MNKRSEADRLKLFESVDLTTEKIRQLAFETGFCKRKSGKIDASYFLINLCIQSVQDTVSYNDLAAQVHSHSGVSASRQAYWERMNESCVRLFQRVLEHVISPMRVHEELDHIKKERRYKRILIQDSTIIRLPLRLFSAFSGVRNAYKAVCNARIQGIYDLVSGRFIQFSIDPYSKNDQAATMDIPVQSGDLILRDRGYFTITSIDNHKKAGCDSIHRYKHETALFDPKTNKKINLLKLLSENDSVDMLVHVDSKKKVTLRLVAEPVNEEIANQRRSKAKKHMRGHAPSQEILDLMSWTIFLTTITDASISFKEILTLYGIRWRIENIIKTWKSNFHFNKIHNVSETQLRVLLSARIIMITIIYQKIFLPMSLKIYKKTKRYLSLMKFMRYVSQNMASLQKLFDCCRGDNDLLQAIIRYCSYEKRKRANFETTTHNILKKIEVAY